MITYALDFESYYDRECSIKTLGPHGYFSHPSFEAYMVTVVGDDGFRYAGHPKEFDWTILKDQLVLSHNASFDETLYLFGVDAGWYPSVDFKEWQCTADMCAFLGLPRSLKGAAAEVLGAQIDKTTRDNMAGKQWSSMSEEFQKEVTEYAIVDSERCLELWQKLEDQWPQHERDISVLSRRITQRGLPMDEPLLQKSLETIKTKLFDSENTIPWIHEIDPKTKKPFTPLSRKAFNNECRKQGIPIPKSLAQDNADADKWFAEHQKECPWARSVQDYRRINSFLSKLESFQAGTMSDGRFYGNIMYCGANPTARWSGGGGNLNLQNLPREEMFGVNFRPLIKAAPDTKLIVADLGQIEVRTVLWWAKDFEALDRIRETDDIYHVLAVMLGIHKEEDGPLRNNPKLRQLTKGIALGCQFGLGPNGYMAQSGGTLEDATFAVNTYQKNMKKVVELWGNLKDDLNMSTALGQPLIYDMPSGRKLNYGRIRKMKTRTPEGKTRFAHVCKMVRQGQKRDFRLWHGHMTNNLAQGLARDVFADTMLRLDAADIPIVMHVHDEVVCEVPASEAEDRRQQIEEIMSTPPAWIPELPLDTEATILDHYTK